MDPLLKHRELSFCPLHPDPNQAQSAMLLLAGIEGVEAVHHLEPLHLHISYYLNRITLQTIEDTLIELGYHLDNSLLVKLKRALVYYSEEAQRSNLGCGQVQQNCARKAYVRRYQQQDHGCRDERPHHWRIYR